MNLEAWSVIGTGIAILIAIATSHRQLRGEIHATRRELKGDVNALRDELKGDINELRGEMNGLRERMAKLEGLLEGLREAITGRRIA